MNNLLIALENIQSIVPSYLRVHKIATEAINSFDGQKFYSDEEVRRVLYEAGKLCTFSKEHCLSVVEELIQSLSPLKEATDTEVKGNSGIFSEGKILFNSRVCEKHTWILVETTATGQEPKTHIQCAYCGASKKNNFEHKEQPISSVVSEIAFVVEARKFGREAAHSYTVAVCDKLELAKEIAEWHADHRGGIYGIKVYQYTKNIGTEALEKSNEQLCVYEIKSPYADEKPSNKSVQIIISPKTDSNE